MSSSAPRLDDDATDPQALFARRFAWFGKLPSAGDFVSRRMSYAVRQFWDGWCAAGMDALKAGSSATGLDVWGSTPQWAFVLPAQPGIDAAQLGVLAPSCDRVGRVFPFVVAAPLAPNDHAMLLDRAGWLGVAWGQVVTEAQRSRLSIEVVDAGLQAALAEALASACEQDDDDRTTLPMGLDPDPSSLPWPELSRTFDWRGSASYWWSVPPASTGHQSRVQLGPLKTLHFLELCR